eukprot:m.513900 g.513900  ORF g.513900 m.513900 type:complete len:50 (-) comp57448_c0_seq15:2951-3100(-)
MTNTSFIRDPSQGIKPLQNRCSMITASVPITSRRNSRKAEEYSNHRLTR